MKLPNPYQCDREGCTVTKGASNHWWLVDIGADDFTVEPWQAKRADLEGVRHVCSEACASKMLSAWMADLHRKAVDAAVEVGAAV